MSELAENTPKKEGFFKSLWKGFISSFKRFPVEALLSVTVFLIHLFVFRENMDSNNDVPLNYDQILVFFVPIFLIAYSFNCLYRQTGKTCLKWTYYASYLLVLVPLFLKIDLDLYISHIVIIYVLSFIFLLTTFRKLPNSSFASNLTALFGTLLFAGLVSAIIGLLLTAIFGTIGILFKPVGIIQLHVWAFNGLVLFPLMACHLYINESVRKTSARVIQFIVNYIVTPALIIYAIILLAYTLRILFNWELPKGGTAYMVSVFCILTLLCISVRHSFEKRTFNWFHRYFPLIALIPLVLMWTGIHRRISDYGLTESRFYLILSASLITVFIAMLLNKRTERFSLMAHILAICLVIFTFIPGLKAKDFGRRSQMAILDRYIPEILIDNKFPADINYEKVNADPKLAKSYLAAYSAYEYLESEMDENKFEEKYGQYGSFYLSKWKLQTEDSDELSNSQHLIDESNHVFVLQGNVELGQYTTYRSHFLIENDSTNIYFLDGTNRADTLLKCNVIEKYDSIYKGSSNALTPEQINDMLTYRNNEYLGILKELHIDSGKLKGYCTNITSATLFKKAGD